MQRQSDCDHVHEPAWLGGQVRPKDGPLGPPMYALFVDGHQPQLSLEAMPVQLVALRHTQLSASYVQEPLNRSAAHVPTAGPEEEPVRQSEVAGHHPQPFPSLRQVEQFAYARHGSAVGGGGDGVGGACVDGPAVGTGGAGGGLGGPSPPDQSVANALMRPMGRSAVQGASWHVLPTSSQQG